MTESPTVLCVDDEDTILATLKLLLESVGLRVITATSAADALKAFQSEQFNAAVLDYSLPNVNGIELARQMKQAKPSMPIVFLSAFSELPGETLGLAEAWFRKAEHSPEQLLIKLNEMVKRNSVQVAPPIGQ